MLKLKWELWFYGLLSGTIQGASAAILSWGGLGAAHAAGMDVPVLNFKALGVVFLSGAIPRFFGYLNTQPLPPIAETTTTITVKETKPVEQTNETKTQTTPPTPGA